jgi:hypothetical protein
MDLTEVRSAPREVPASTVWSIVVLVLLSLYLVGFVAILAWWLLNGHPYPSSGGNNFPDMDEYTPYQASRVGLFAFGYVAAAAAVAVVCIAIAAIAWAVSSRGQRMWPGVMTGVSLASGALMIPAGLFAGTIVLFSLP